MLYCRILAVDPRVNNNLRSFWQLQFGDSGLNSFVCNSKTLNSDNLIAITRRMQVGTKAGIELECFCGQVDNSLVELVLSRLLESKWYRDTGTALQSSGDSK
jgi:hypothetical protein